MEKYSSGKIYILSNDKTQDVYVGSTTTELYKRLHQHKVACNAKRKCMSAKLFEDGAVVSIKLVEAYPCKSKLELNLRENHWIQQTPNVINKVLNPGVEDKKAHRKAYLKENAERFREANLAYKAEHKEEAALQHKLWAETNKDHIKEHKNEKVMCEKCNRLISRGSMYRHVKTKEHTDGVAPKNLKK